MGTVHNCFSGDMVSICLGQDDGRSTRLIPAVV